MSAPSFHITVFLLAVVPAVLAAPPPVQVRVDSTAVAGPEALAATIDRLIAARWAARKVQPTALADDAEFIRRVYLDMAGCIPCIIDARDFLDDTRPDKRHIWLEELLEGKRPADKPEAYAGHFANVWRAWILAGSGADAQRLAPNLEAWFRQRLQKNVPYDQIVRDMVAPPPSDTLLFDQVNEQKPEELAAGTARLFLGIKLECAQCHDDRSGGNWTRTQFWELAAFFVDRQPQGKQPARPPTIVIPGKNTRVAARFLDGRQPTWSPQFNARAALAEWLTNPHNRYFARAAVNRLWSYFFGIGLVEPMEEQGGHNPPSHPELLDVLAEQFAAHHFDLKYLIRAIVQSRTYQLSSVVAGPRPHATEQGAGQAPEHDPRLFSQRAIRGLTPEQIFDSLAEATETADSGSARETSGPRAQFVERFANRDRSTETQTSVLQALFLMNSRFMADRTSPDHNQTLATIAKAARITTERRVEQLFLVVLSRKPSSAELARLVKYVNGGGVAGDRSAALADVFWALINSAEFRVNH